jgi:DNA-binding LytR/AlgR family response regulator
LVNLQKVKQVKGNAQGYNLEIKSHSEPLPVSRGMIADFERKFKEV